MNFTCASCHACFSFRSSFRRHVKLSCPVHAKDPRPPLICISCHVGFNRKDSYRRHVRFARCGRKAGGQAKNSHNLSSAKVQEALHTNYSSSQPAFLMKRIQVILNHLEEGIDSLTRGHPDHARAHGKTLLYGLVLIQPLAVDSHIQNDKDFWKQVGRFMNDLRRYLPPCVILKNLCQFSLDLGWIASMRNLEQQSIFVQALHEVQSLKLNISQAYEFSFNEKLKCGLFYTPPELSSKMATEALSQLSLNSKKTGVQIIDLSCGTGNLLVAGQKACLEAGVLHTTYFGCDIDSVAVDIATLRMPMENVSLLCQDILAFSVSQLDTREGYTRIVVGNPPFVRLSKGAFVKRKLRNLYGIFLEKSMDCTREGDVLCVLLPKSFLIHIKAPELRYRLLQQFENIKIYVYEVPFIRNIWGNIQSACVLLVGKCRQSLLRTFPMEGPALTMYSGINLKASTVEWSWLTAAYNFSIRSFHPLFARISALPGVSFLECMSRPHQNRAFQSTGSCSVKYVSSRDILYPFCVVPKIKEKRYNRLPTSKPCIGRRYTAEVEALRRCYAAILPVNTATFQVHPHYVSPPDDSYPSDIYFYLGMYNSLVFDFLLQQVSLTKSITNEHLSKVQIPAMLISPLDVVHMHEKLESLWCSYLLVIPTDREIGICEVLEDLFQFDSVISRSQDLASLISFGAQKMEESLKEYFRRYKEVPKLKFGVPESFREIRRQETLLNHLVAMWYDLSVEDYTEISNWLKQKG